MSLHQDYQCYLIYSLKRFDDLTIKHGSINMCSLQIVNPHTRRAMSTVQQSVMFLIKNQVPDWVTNPVLKQVILPDYQNVMSLLCRNSFLTALPKYQLLDCRLHFIQLQIKQQPLSSVNGSKMCFVTKAIYPPQWNIKWHLWFLSCPNVWLSGAHDYLSTH